MEIVKLGEVDSATIFLKAFRDSDSLSAAVSGSATINSLASISADQVDYP
jgi:hypothetical protein